MRTEIEITKELQDALKKCAPETCNAECVASMSNGDCLFDYIDLEDEQFVNEFQRRA